MTNSPMDGHECSQEVTLPIRSSIAQHQPIQLLVLVEVEGSGGGLCSHSSRRHQRPCHEVHHVDGGDDAARLVFKVTWTRTRS